VAFPQDQFPGFPEQRLGRVCHLVSQFFFTLDFGESGQFPPRKLQEDLHLVVNIGAPGSRRGFLAREQLRNVGFRDLRGGREPSLLETQILQPVPDNQRNVHTALH
jgi:hypothetical protein